MYRHDRLSHLYTIGRTGTGKSTFLKTLLAQDIAFGSGCALLDPHGDLAEDLRAHIPTWRAPQVHYLDAADPTADFAFNPLAGIEPAKRSLAVANLVEVFQKLWPKEWGPRLEHVLRHSLATLVEIPGTSLGDLPRLLTDTTYCTELVSKLQSPEVREFWQGEYAGYTPGMRSVVIAPVLNKVGAFLADPILRRILTAPTSSFNLRQIMDGGQVLLVNLAKGRLGEGPAGLLGSLLVASIARAGLERADTRERRPFFLYLDEFQSFATLSLATMLSELRKYGVGLVLAHQFLGQLDTAIRDAVFGNVGTFVSFRVGALDAPTIAREMAPVFTANDLSTLPNYHIYLRLMINGQVSKPFSAKTIPPEELPHFKAA